MSRKSKAAEFVQEGYSITITGRHVQITDAIRDYAREKIFKIERLSNRIIDVTVTMDIQKFEHRVDIIIRVDNLIIKSHGSSDNMYASIDMAVDKIQKQLSRYKRRIHEHQAKPNKTENLNVSVVRSTTPSEELEEINEEIEYQNAVKDQEALQFHRIVSQETKQLRTLTNDEALMKLELSNDQFLIFRNEASRDINVIYRRNDGNFGIIEIK